MQQQKFNDLVFQSFQHYITLYILYSKYLSDQLTLSRKGDLKS